ncbi:MAG: M14 family zinc carboxypeptidase, partial [Gemmatimonas sp.]|uniref:M14 family metallopeptidase n=1 Tax=Gemmatimonas sp. TaxID=1962908 RepID=UPI00391A37B7
MPRSHRRRVSPWSAALLMAAVLPLTAHAQQRTTPEQFFGHRIGADYELPNYTKLHQWFITVAKESDRVALDTIGLTEEGRPQIMAIVTSPENHRKLARYKEISTKLAKADGVDSAAAAAMAKEGKVIFWIDGGLHATDVLGAQQLMETLWQLSSRTDDETVRILNDVVILMTHANPDGMELVTNWYMKESDKLKRTTATIPRLYEKYAGHDNNRDSYMNALAETRNMSSQLFIEWHPQIMYNHHQTGPTGTVMAAPPYRDPANFWFHPAMITGLDLVGAALNHRFVLEHKPGLTFRAGSNYSTWWNGGLRTTGYYHNQIGILTETIGNPTPMRIALVPERQVRSAGLPMPIEPQVWHFRQSIDYSVSANYAFLDLASRYRETFLFNRWVMGQDQIKAGQKDTWTISPKRVAAMAAKIQADRGTVAAENRAGGPRGGGVAPNVMNAVANDRYMAELKKPENRDPRAYVLSAAQQDFPTATKFVRALQYSGIDVHKATAPFSANGKQFPA